MAVRWPVAFLSYVRDDDAHDFGAVTTFRERLEGEVKVQSGNYGALNFTRRRY